MLLYWHGHSEFCIENAEGYKILFDPFDRETGYPYHKCMADAVLVSHAHHDHSDIGKVTGNPRIIRDAGEYSLSPDVMVHAITAHHDDCGGKKRGDTLLFTVETENLRVAHLGDLGEELSDEQAAALGRVDILMICVGGFYTIDGVQAARTAERLGARVVLPMHYKTEYNSSWPIENEESFLRAYGKPAERVPLLRVTAGDLSCQPQVALMTIFS